MTVIRYNVARMQSVAESMTRQSSTLSDRVENAWSKLATIFQDPDLPVAMKTSANIQGFMTDTIRMLAKLLAERDTLPQNLQQMASNMQVTDSMLASEVNQPSPHAADTAM